MSIEKRIENLEKRTGAGMQIVITVSFDGDETQPTEAQRESAISEYKARNPDWEDKDAIVLSWKDGQFGKRG